MTELFSVLLIHGGSSHSYSLLPTAYSLKS